MPTARAPTAFRACGVRIDALRMSEAVAAICTAAAAGEAQAVHLVNAYTLSLAMRDEAFRAELDAGDLNLPDGQPLVWAGRWAGVRRIRRRVYGPDLTLAVADTGRDAGVSHYLYGGTREVVAALASNLRARFPGITIAGIESPPFRSLTAAEEDEAVDRIGASGADVVWVGLGTPKQDWFVARFAERLSRPCVAVGAAFDFIAGAKRQAPLWMQRNGLEWTYRLAREPRRLWRRYLLGNARFLAGLARGVQPVDPPPAAGR